MVGTEKISSGMVAVIVTGEGAVKAAVEAGVENAQRVGEIVDPCDSRPSEGVAGMLPQAAKAEMRPAESRQENSLE